MTDLRDLPDGEPLDGINEHLAECPECGQTFDMRRLDQVFHHAQAGHQPMKAD